jgi:hypothetical protein
MVAEIAGELNSIAILGVSPGRGILLTPAFVARIVR